MLKEKLGGVYMQEEETRQTVTTYEIHHKTYTVITRCVKDVQPMDKLYDVLCKYAMSQMQ